MFVNDAIDLAKKYNLKARARLVLQAIAFFSNKNNKCYPCQKTLAEQTGLCVSTVKNALNDLVAVGLITKIRQLKQGKYTTNLYIITPEPEEKPKELSPQEQEKYLNQLGFYYGQPAPADEEPKLRLLERARVSFAKLVKLTNQQVCKFFRPKTRITNHSQSGRCFNHKDNNANHSQDCKKRKTKPETMENDDP